MVVGPSYRAQGCFSRNLYYYSSTNANNYSRAIHARTCVLYRPVQCLRHHVRRQTELDPIFMNRSGLLRSLNQTNTTKFTSLYHRHSSSVLVLALGLQDTGHQTGVYTRRVALLVSPSPVVVGWKCLVAGAISCCCCYWPYWCCWHQTMKAPEFCRA